MGFTPQIGKQYNRITVLKADMFDRVHLEAIKKSNEYWAVLEFDDRIEWWVKRPVPRQLTDTLIRVGIRHYHEVEVFTQEMFRRFTAQVW